jgi:hypothetical protein
MLLAYFRGDGLQHTEVKSKPLQQIDAIDDSQCEEHSKTKSGSCLTVIDPMAVTIAELGKNV